MKPVIVLAFSNDRDDYLDMINRERKNIFNALREYDDNELIQVRKQESTSVEDLFELFNLYRDQVAIFHYGGHANGTHLQLETSEGESQLANALGLAQLMGQQEQLQLVFLNGCATSNQVELLLSAGVRAVIATSVPIDDMMAAEFAQQFYNTLGEQATIKEAFENAKAFITTRYGPSREINIYPSREVSWEGKEQVMNKELVWGLYINENSPEVLEWKLPSTWDPLRSPGEKTLEDVLKDRKKMQSKEIVDIGKQVCILLEKDHHDRGVKNNITPENVILDESNKVVSIRFGSGDLQGISHYISPEQTLGAEPDFRANIWSLGVILYEMAAGQLPFKGESRQAVIDSIVNKTPRPLTDIDTNVPIELEKIILKCLCKNRKFRYPSPRELLFDLKKLEKFLSAKKTKMITTSPSEESTCEFRMVTVMCGKISGYNEMGEKLGIEEAASIIKSCFKMFATVIKKFGGSGIENKIIGRSFTTFFGLPTALENAPGKAVGAAIEMQDNFYRLKREQDLQVSLDIHIGIDTGTVIAEIVADENKGINNVLGDAVTLASRLKELAAKGEIYIGQLTQGYTGNEFEYKQLEPITLEGKKRPVRVFKLLSPKKKINRLIDSKMVGRDKDLDKLKFHVLKVINGEGSIVSVIGEAGIGKSRLIAELKKKDDLKKVTLLEGRALSIGKNLSYHPIMDLLKNWAKIKEEDSKTQSLYKLEHTIANLYPAGIVDVFPFVATLMGMKLTGRYAERVKGIEGEAMEKHILKSLRDLMIKCAQRRPIVVIIEDLHWADISSIEMLESFFRLAENHRILYINVLRPNYKETGERVLATIRERYGRTYSEIELEPLDEKQCEILIQNLVKFSRLPSPVMTSITNRAEGNPFFIEEVVRSFIDEGVVEIKDGEFKATEKIDSVVIPETIQDVVMARIDRLEKNTRNLLKDASVIGRFFFHKILSEVTDTTGDIDNKLEYLKGIQLIRERKRLDEIEYLFKHALAQEVTYESILLNKRKELHLHVANAIETVFKGRLHEFYGMLALHYSKGENLYKAEEYLINAGEEALKAAASTEALSYFREALAIYFKKTAEAVDLEKIAMLNKNIGIALFNKGYYAEAIEYFDKVLSYWGKKGPENKFKLYLKLLVNLLSLLKNLYFPTKKSKKIPGKRDSEIVNLAGKKGEALSAVDATRFFMESVGMLTLLIKFDVSKIENGASIFTSCSALFSYTGISFKISRKILDYIKDYIDKKDIKCSLVYNHIQLLHNFYAGTWPGEFECDENLIDKGLNVGEFFYTLVYTLVSGLLKIEQGNFNCAKGLVNKLCEIGENYQSELIIGRKYTLNTKLLLKSRRLYDGLKEAEDGISILNRVGQNVYCFVVIGMKANIQILLKDITGAENSLLQAKILIAYEKKVGPSYRSSFLISQFLLDLYMLEEALDCKDKSKISQFRGKAYHSGKMAVKNSMKFAADQTEVFKLMGVYYWLTGKQKKALAWWNKSLTIGQRLGARLELARTYMEIGKRLTEKKSKFQQLNQIPAGEYLEKARALFNQMELEWDLQELEKISSQVEERGC